MHKMSDCRLFNVDFERQTCPCAGRVSAENTIDSDNGTFSGRSTQVNMLTQSVIPLYVILQTV